MTNAQREYNQALNTLRYWQRELRFRRTARRPRTETISQGERRVRNAIHWVCFWRAVATGPRRRQVRNDWRLAHWRAFVVPTEFERSAVAP
jgi:hypothetical protein